jgi:hypothetical protein
VSNLHRVGVVIRHAKRILHDFSRQCVCATLLRKRNYAYLLLWRRLCQPPVDRPLTQGGSTISRESIAALLKNEVHRWLIRRTKRFLMIFLCG